MMFNQAMGFEARLHVTKHRRDLALYLENFAPGTDGKPSRSRALAFYEFFKESNSRLAAQYFRRSQLFDEDFDEYPEHELDKDFESAALLLSNFYASRISNRDFSLQNEDQGEDLLNRT